MSDTEIIEDLFESLNVFAYEEMEERDWWGDMDAPQSLNYKFRISSDTHDFYTSILSDDVVDLLKTSEKKFVITVSRTELRDGTKNIRYRKKLQELIDACKSTEEADIDDSELYRLRPQCRVHLKFAWEFADGAQKVLKTVKASGSWIRALSDGLKEFKKTFNLQRDFIDILKGDGSVVQ